MESVPNIISTKDLSYLEDMLNWNFILIKKLNNYTNIVNDNNVKKILSKTSNSLLNDYKTILNYINKEELWEKH